MFLSMFWILRQFDATTQETIRGPPAHSRLLSVGLVPDSHSRVSGIADKIILEFAN